MRYEPMGGYQGSAWAWFRDHSGATHDTSDLPPALFALLPGTAVTEAVYVYESRKDALDALKVARVRLAAPEMLAACV